MPTKQTKEAIEAELNASERDRILAELREAIASVDDFERELQALEAQNGLPASQQSKSLAERMAVLGLSQASIDIMQKHLEAFALIDAGRIDEVPTDMKQALAQRADGELTGVELLAKLVSEVPKGTSR
jgi:hypothetical protein